MTDCWNDFPTEGTPIEGGLYYHSYWNNNPHSIRYEYHKPEGKTWLEGASLICPRCDSEMTEVANWGCTQECDEEFLDGKADAKLLQKPRSRDISYMKGYRTGEQQLNCQRYCTSK